MSDVRECRGKRVDGEEWVTGYYAEIGLHKIILTGKIIEDKNNYLDWERYEVIPETVGQYTGLTDKNGTRIFEGDFVTVNTYSYEEPEYTASGYIDMSPLGIGLRFPKAGGTSEFGYLCDMRGSYLTEYVMYGNVWDNPELIEED